MYKSSDFPVKNIKYAGALPLALLGLFTLASQPALAARPAEIDRLTGRWLQIEQQNQNLIHDWKIQKPAMEQRLSLLQAEKQQLNKMLQESTAGQDDVEARRSELLAKQAELESQQQKLATSLTRLQSAVDSLTPMLPPTVRDSWEKEEQAVGNPSEMSVLLQGILARLSDLTEFDQRISTNETVIAAPDGEDVLVKQFFLGAGFAWFTSSDGDYAGFGSVTDRRWNWQFDDDVDGEDINRAIAIFEKRLQPQLIQLPLILNDSATQQTSGVQP